MTKNKEATKYLSEIQEVNIARAIDGRRTPMSGAGMFMKGDVRTRLFTIEAKTQMTEKKTFSVKSEWLRKLEEESFQNGTPYHALAFNFGGENNQKENYYVITGDLFKKLVKIMEDD